MIEGEPDLGKSCLACCAESVASGDFPLQVAHLALTRWAGTRTVTFVVAFYGRILNAVGMCNVKSDRLERIADMFTAILHKSSQICKTDKNKHFFQINEIFSQIREEIGEYSHP